MVEHPDVNGRRAAMPVPYHKGRDLQRGILRALIRRFNLPNNIFD
jgi:predicted RNA binding protein YcfA (HicA-like mRNA interferase family)